MTHARTIAQTATNPNDNRVSCNKDIGIATTGTPVIRGALAVHSADRTIEEYPVRHLQD